MLCCGVHHVFIWLVVDCSWIVCCVKCLICISLCVADLKRRNSNV